jgi:hypothetical protein
MDLIELERWLQMQRGEDPDKKIKARTAKVNSAAVLLESGYFTPEEVSYFEGLPLSVVQAEQARIAREENDRMEYLTTGQVPEDPRAMAHFTIFQ